MRDDCFIFLPAMFATIIMYRDKLTEVIEVVFVCHFALILMK